MKDIVKMAAALRSSVSEGRQAALATVVKLEGSGYRRPGARMVVLDDGTRVGFLSGGCLEADVAEHARQAMAAGHPRVLSYDGRSGFDPVAELGCNGSIQILVEPASEAIVRSVGFVEQFEWRRGRGAMATVFRVGGASPVRIGERLTMREGGKVESEIDNIRVSSSLIGSLDRVIAGGRAEVEMLHGMGWEAEALIEPIVSPIGLVLCGAGYDAVPLAALAKSLGWHVTVVDRREHLLTDARFPDADRLLPESEWSPSFLDERSAVVVMSHSYAWDLRMLGTLSSSRAGYVGLLGPRKRAQQMRLDLLEEGVVLGGSFGERLHSPTGLDIGAETAEEIALSVVSEIQAFFAERHGGYLRERRGAIHETGD